MKAYLVSLAAGIFVGIIYGLLHVRSPAPPVVALVGLLGILIGEQVIPFGNHFFDGGTWRATQNRADTLSHLFGQLPGHNRFPSGKSKEDKNS